MSLPKNITMKYPINHEFVSISSYKATHRIILLHGWGADAEDLLPLGEEILKGSKFKFEILSLRAPSLRPNNDGRQWYGLYPPNWNEAKNEVKNLLFSLQILGDHNIPLKKTILMGFSQGAAMALDTGSQLDLGLIISCSGYPHPSWEPRKLSSPTILSHGNKDEVVPLQASRKVLENLKNIGNKNCELFEFDGYHQIDLNLINKISCKINVLF